MRKHRIQIPVIGSVGGGITSPPFTQTALPTADFYVADTGIVGHGLSAADPTTFADAWSRLTADGQKIKLVGDTTVPQFHNWSRTVTLFADYGTYDADPLGNGLGPINSRLSRPVKLKFLSPNADGVTTNGHLSTITAGKTLTLLGGIKTAYERWPATVTDNWSTVGFNDGANAAFIGGSVSGGVYSKIVLDGVEICHGYGPRSFAAYDPTEKLPEFNSPAKFDLDGSGNTVAGTTLTGWGDATFPARNNCARAPQFLGGRFDQITIKNCHVHDLSWFCLPVIPGNAIIDIHDNWIERTIGDAIQLNIESGTRFTGSIKVNRNVFLDPVGHSFDGGNPHVDAIQIYSVVSGLTQETAYSIDNFGSSNNIFAITRKGSRSQFQVHWLTASQLHEAGTNFALMGAPKVRNCLAVGAGYKGYAADVSRDPYIRNCAFIIPEWWTDSGNNTQPGSLTFNHAFLASDGVTVLLNVEDTKALVSGTIYETSIGGESVLLVNSTDAGLKGASVPHASIFADPSDPGATVLKPGQMFAKYKTIGAYASQGPQYANLRAMLSDTLDFTGERPHIGVVDLINQAAATQVTSNISYIHGGDVGDTLTLTLSAGVEVQQYDSDRSTVLQAWSSAQTTLTVGRFVQFRVTTPAAGLVSNYTITVGGVAFSWAVAAASNAAYPQIAFSGDDRFAQSAPEAMADSRYTTWAFKAKMPASAPAATTYLLTPVLSTGGSTAAWIRFALATTGQLDISAYKADGTLLMRALTAASQCDGAEHEYVFAIDTNQTTAAAGFLLYRDGTKIASFTINTWNGGAGISIGYSRTTSSPRWAFGTTTFIPGGFELHYAYLNIADRLDLTNPTTALAKFAADQMGTNGSGPTGSQPYMLFVGNATQMNDATTGVNFGSGTKLKIQASATVTDVTPGQAAWS